jgi:hypothetical protein
LNKVAVFIFEPRLPFKIFSEVNPKVVSERVGHLTIKLTLDVYSQVLPTMQEEATNHLESFIFSNTNSD